MEKLNEKTIERKASQLREQAKDVLKANKVWGGIVGILPGVDMILQKFVIKKNAMKKVGKIFGIDIKFVEENQKKINKEKDKKNNEINNEIKDEIKIEEKDEIKIEEKDEKKDEIIIEEKDEIQDIQNGILKDEIKDKQKDILKDEIKDEIKNKQIDKLKEEKKDEDNIFSNPNIDKTSLKQIKEKDLTKEPVKNKIYNDNRFTSETESYVESGFSIGTSIGRIAAKGLGYCGIGLSAVVGIGLGGYLTHKYCEKLIDKFVIYYKENAKKINNSYKQALQYFNPNEDDVEEEEGNNLSFEIIEEEDEEGNNLSFEIIEEEKEGNNLSFEIIDNIN